MDSVFDFGGRLKPCLGMLSEGILFEVERFSAFRRVIISKVAREFIREKNKVVETAINTALELYSGKLTCMDWLTLEVFLLKNVFLVLQGVNDAIKQRYSCV